MRKKRLYWLAMVLAVLITKATSSTSDGEDDDMDDDIYADVQVNADLLNRLLELISNSSTSTTSTTTDRPSIKLLIDRSSIQQQQQRPVSLLKLPVILASLNEQSRKLFTNFKVFFIVLLTVLVVLISLTMILILANFMVNKRALCRPATLSRAKKKSTLSFDIIDNGYRQSRPNVYWKFINFVSFVFVRIVWCYVCVRFSYLLREIESGKLMTKIGNLFTNW